MSFQAVVHQSRRPRRLRSAFTLLELTVVVVVLAVVSLIAVPTFRSLVSGSEDKVVEQSVVAFARSAAMQRKLDPSVSWSVAVQEAIGSSDAPSAFGEAGFYAEPSRWVLVADTPDTVGEIQIVGGAYDFEVMLLTLLPSAGDVLEVTVSQDGGVSVERDNIDPGTGPGAGDGSTTTVTTTTTTTTPATTTTLPPPDMFTDLTLEFVNLDALLRWSPAAAAVGYDVYRSTTDDRSSAVKLTSSALSNSANRYDDPELTDGVTYFWWLEATDGSRTQSAQVSGAATAPLTVAFNGSFSTLVIPAGQSFMVADLSGAQGGASIHGTGGLGGRIRANVPVTAGETLRVYVGGQGGTSTAGFNGGGTPTGSTGGGGGATDIRRDSLDGTVGNWSLNDRILVAGAGGGGGWNNTCATFPVIFNGGAGSGGRFGGDARTEAVPTGGMGAVDTYGGLGGLTLTSTYASAGTLGTGAAGSSNGVAGCSNRVGGAGGGGYYGGGGGGATTSGNGGGGGGGNGFAHASTTAASSWAGTRSGHGVALIAYPSSQATTIATSTVAEREFFCVGREQRFRVPAGVTTVAADLHGAQGGSTTPNGGVGGLGGRISANLPGLTPGALLQVNVGCAPTSTGAGWNGGGTGGGGSSGGGGASDVRVDDNSNVTYALDERYLAAGGGGGAAYNNCQTVTGFDGGAGTGGNAAGAGTTVHHGTGARGTQGGVGGPNLTTGYAASGTLGVGGNGSSNSASGCSLRGGGGGGGGYYGGGGAGGVTGFDGGGGGGGNGFAHSSATAVSTWQGTRSGHGSVTLNWATPYTATAASDVTADNVMTFACIGRTQRAFIPQGMTQLGATLGGAPGGTSTTGNGGAGAAVQATLPVTELTTVQVNVGCTPTTSTGGYNGGGGGGSTGARGGGGATDVRVDTAATPTFDLTTRVAVAGGGGGAGLFNCGASVVYHGGHGGAVGNDGEISGGGGGTAAAGGAGSNSGTAGVSGTGGTGANNAASGCSIRSGGGGGGGWFGGGAGGTNASGGGGGSSYTAPGATSVSVTTGTSTANGSAVLTFVP
jgi:prepilin-type N-terminal cleavage/methylation domain-containing protein